MTAPGSNAYWSDLAGIWREQRAPVELERAMARRVRRESWGIRAMAVLDLVLVLMLVPVTSRLAAAGMSAAATTAIAALWLVNAGFMGFALWNRRGIWAAESETPRAYTRLMQRRARARIRTARFVRIVVFVQAAVVVLAVRTVPAISSPGTAAPADRTWPAIFLATAMVLMFVGWSYWFETRAQADLADFDYAARMLDA